jgi:hypothetical protein
MHVHAHRCRRQSRLRAIRTEPFHQAHTSVSRRLGSGDRRASARWCRLRRGWLVHRPVVPRAAGAEVDARFRAIDASQPGRPPRAANRPPYGGDEDVLHECRLPRAAAAEHAVHHAGRSAGIGRRRPTGRPAPRPATAHRRGQRRHGVRRLRRNGVDARLSPAPDMVHGTATTC